MSAHAPGEPQDASALRCLVLTTSDSRTLVTDRGGAYAAKVLADASHEVVARHIVVDEVDAIRAEVLAAVESGAIDVLVICGGTGLGPRDVTPDAVVPLFGKQLPGFGEAVRALTLAGLGPRAMLSRATAGVITRTLVFLLPGSPDYVRLAMDQLVLPVVGEACAQLGRLEILSDGYKEGELLPGHRPT